MSRIACRPCSTLGAVSIGLRFVKRSSRNPGLPIVSLHASTTPDREVEAAIARVLAAERGAQQAIAAARAEAAAIAERSRAEARSVAEQTQRRMRRLRAAFERRTEAELAALQLQAEALAAPQPPDADDGVRVDGAVARLVAELTEARP